MEQHVVDKSVERIGAKTEPGRAGPAPDAAAQGSELRWWVPEGWAREPGSRPMRLATLIAPDPAGAVEVAVTRFPGRVGGELANVNRWRGQLGLGPMTRGELNRAITRFASPGFEGYQTRIESPAGVILAAGVYEAATDQTWFVRATVAGSAIADRIQADLFAVARSLARPTHEVGQP